MHVLVPTVMGRSLSCNAREGYKKMQWWVENSNDGKMSTPCHVIYKSEELDDDRGP